MEEHLKQNIATAFKGILGTVSPITGAVVSSTVEFETWLRILSLIVGISVGIASLWSILRNRKDKP